jgi:lipopolysaccharide transport system permease protein
MKSNEEVHLDPSVWPAVVGAPLSLDAEAESDGWVVIGAPRTWHTIDFRALWQYRELLYFLAWRDVKVRYKQTAIGAAWAVLQPLLTMLIFSVVFGRFAKIPSDGVPYPIFAFAALVPWTFFSYALTQSGNSLVANAGLISKVYFPRLIIPIAACLPGLVDLAIALTVLGGMMIFYGISPTPALIVLPAFVLLALAAALAVTLWLSALNVRYRDVRYTIPFLTQVWLYATPIAYPASMIHGKLHEVLALNPMTGVVEGFRWSLLGGTSLDVESICLSTGITVLTLAAGLLYFRATERSFADII